MLVRRSCVNLTYEGVNITDSIAKDLLGFTYTDNASGSADDINISLKDEKKKWLTSWAPKKGDSIEAIIKTINWKHEGDAQSLYCGSFMVDEPFYSGRPIVLNLGAISIPADTDFKDTEKSRVWNHASVKEIATTIASCAGIKLYYDTKYNPIIDFIEQSEKTDSAFLSEICTKNGLAMKIYSNKLVIFNEMEYEQKQAIDTIYESNTEPSWNAKTSLANTGYDGCAVSYMNPNNGKLYKYIFMAPGKTGKKIYKINETVNSYAEAERLAKNKLRELNKKEYTLTITIPGNVHMIASSCVHIKEFGVFDGKYYIDKAVHNIGSGYTTKLELHKCLEGY